MRNLQAVGWQRVDRGLYEIRRLEQAENEESGGRLAVPRSADLLGPGCV